MTLNLDIKLGSELKLEDYAPYNNYLLRYDNIL